MALEISDQVCSELTEGYYAERGVSSPKAVNGMQLGMMAQNITS